MEEYQGEMLQFPLGNLNKMGLLNFNQISIQRKLYTIFFGFVGVYCISSTFLQYFYMKKNNVFDFTDNTEAFGGLSQILVKFGFCIYFKDDFINLIQLSKQFWNTEKSCKFLQNEIHGTRQKIIIFQKVYFYSILIFSPAFFISTFFGKKLPAGSWNMDNQGIFYRSVYVGYVLVIPMITVFVTSFEGLFLGFCYEIKTQFMILGDRFENLSVDHVRNCEDLVAYNIQLRSNIQHHILLIKFVQDLQKTFSLSFMVQCLTVAPMICTEMYAVTESTSTLMMFRYGFICLGLFVQFAFYCIPGSLVTDAASIISDGIYNSDWLSKSFPQLRIPIMLLIQASQRELKFSACDLITININTFVKVVKVAFSANAVLKSLKD